MTKLYCDFIACIEDWVTTVIYNTFWKILPTIYRTVDKYKKYAAYYTVLAISNQYIEDVGNIKVNYILIFIDDTLSKLYKY